MLVTLVCPWYEYHRATLLPALYVRRDRVEADPKLRFLASLQPPDVIRFRRN